MRWALGESKGDGGDSPSCQPTTHTRSEDGVGAATASQRPLLGCKQQRGHTCICAFFMQLARRLCRVFRGFRRGRPVLGGRKKGGCVKLRLAVESRSCRRGTGCLWPGLRRQGGLATECHNPQPRASRPNGGHFFVVKDVKLLRNTLSRPGHSVAGLLRRQRCPGRRPNGVPASPGTGPPRRLL